MESVKVSILQPIYINVEKEGANIIVSPQLSGDELELVQGGDTDLHHHDTRYHTKTEIESRTIDGGLILF